MRVTGARLNEDSFSIQVRDGGGRFIHSKDGARRTKSREAGRRCRPIKGSYRRGITDLVAYLASLKEAK